MLPTSQYRPRRRGQIHVPGYWPGYNSVQEGAVGSLSTILIPTAFFYRCLATIQCNFIQASDGRMLTVLEAPSPTGLKAQTFPIGRCGQEYAILFSLGMLYERERERERESVCVCVWVCVRVCVCVRVIT